MRRPQLSLWRAAVEGSLLARKSKEPVALVSHLPMAAATTNTMRRALGVDVRQIAFAFNFTDLPSGRRADFYRRALKGIDEFVVFSRYEVELYARALDIPSERIQFLHWAMDRPALAGENPLPTTTRDTGYIAAIGGEGRDYRTFAKAMWRLPRVNAVVVGRPYAIAGVDFPPNVKVFVNLPLDTTWRIAADSFGMVVPLKTSATATGHITIVGAQILGLPLAVTNSLGVADYVSPQNALMVPVGDADRLAEAILGLAGEQACAKAARVDAANRSDPRLWVDYFERFAARAA